MTANNTQLFESLTEEQKRQLAEAAAKVDIIIDKAYEIVNKSVQQIIAAITSAVLELIEAVDAAANGLAALAAEWNIEKRMERVATPKEWHLMNHAKKARTRKKYRNRLLRRLQEGEHHADSTT